MSNPIVLSGWTLKIDNGEPRVRDVDLADKAGLAKPRNIRRVIKGAADDGALSLVEGGGAHNEGAPLPTAWVERETVSGNDTDVFYLNEEAAMLVLTRLRTPTAVQATRALVMVCAAARRGGAIEARAPRALEPPSTAALETYREAVAALEVAKVEGALDGKGLALRQAALLKTHLGVDILSAPLECFAALPDLPQLSAGSSVVLSVPVDETGLHSATEIAAPYHLPPIFVGDLARRLAIFGAAEFGAYVEVLVNGRPKRKNWMYNDASVARLAHGLEEESQRRRMAAEAKLARADERARREAVKGAADAYVQRAEEGGVTK